MNNFLKNMNNFLLLLIVGVGYLISFLTILVIAGYFLAQAWVYLLKTFFHRISFNNQTLIDEGFLTFVLLIILFINSYLDIPADKLRFSKLYLDCFKSPEQAIKFWLIFRFYFSLVSGFLIVSFSIKSFFSLCTVDFTKAVITIVTDPDIYIGKYLSELKMEEIKNFSITLIFAIVAYLSVFLVSKKKELPFLQAFLIVFITGCLLL